MRVPKLLLSAVAVSLIAAAPAGAHHGVSVKTIAKKLDNPRHIAVARNGDVYVAEAGKGGDPAKSKSCFDSAEGFACTGATGAITRVFEKHHRWQQDRVVRGLASFAPADGASAIGPHGVFVRGRDVFFTNGGPTEPTRGGQTVFRDPTLVSEEPISRLYGTLLKLSKRGRVRFVADLWRFERDNNPDADVANTHIDSNPVDVYATRHGLLVADAGGNTVLRVGRHGRISVVAVFPNTPPEPTGMQAVPTGAVVGPDGFYYVSQLTGFPFPVGGANIFRVNPRTGAYTTYASGFTNAMDLAFGRDGTLYVLEIDHDSLFPPVGPSKEGALLRVRRGGGTPQRIELPAGTLTEPGGLAVAGRKTLVVSNHGREAGNGEVLEVTLDR
ncbi:MAG TPA: ScyD/ScyE family protein [Solirubrobacteraceae bacterium]|nr:ScyD/ScyE family protein [Solirubrobacteraceae bacterium]